MSSAAFILETLTRGEYAQFFVSVELMFVIVCTLELALRLYATPVRWRLTMVRGTRTTGLTFCGRTYCVRLSCGWWHGVPKHRRTVPCRRGLDV